jgi:hypothetical protein
MKNIVIRNSWEEFINQYKEYFMSNEEIWYKRLNKLKEYIDINNKRPSQTDKNKEIKQLGVWLQTQITNYKNETYIMKDVEIKNSWEEFINKYKI